MTRPADEVLAPPPRAGYAADLFTPQRLDPAVDAPPTRRRARRTKPSTAEPPPPEHAGPVAPSAEHPERATAEAPSPEQPAERSVAPSAEHPERALPGGRSVVEGRAAVLPDAPTGAALWLACSLSPAFFLHRFGHVYDPLARGWQPFHLWPSQVAALGKLAQGRLAVILKARQLGISWLAVGFGLWQMIFRPAATVLLFSQRDDEAVHLLTFRLRGMYDRLPPLFQARQVLRDNAHEFRLSNGSAALAFPTTGGRSYTASLAIVDEADHLGGATGDDLDALLNAVKPTIDAGGRLILLSTVDKTRPESPLKRIYRAAVRGENDYTPIFLPWSARPDRTPEWYASVRQDILARTGGLDDLHQEYPATDLEALAPRAVDKYFPAALLQKQYAPLTQARPEIQTCREEETCQEDQTCQVSGLPQPALTGLHAGLCALTIHVPPHPDHVYVIGADPAEGNPQSDESAAVVLDIDTHEQAATLGIRCDPALFAQRLVELAEFYGGAAILVERNNHGHAVLLALSQSGARLLYGKDGARGWLTTGATKAEAFAHAITALRDGAVILHDEATYWQLASLDGGTLRAPQGQHDDRAMACILALAAVEFCGAGGRGASAIIPPALTIEDIDRMPW